MKTDTAILVFSGSRSIQVGRDGRSNYSFDGLKQSGLGKIASELSRPVDYCSTVDVDHYKHVLVSLCSYHDVLNLVLNVPRKRSAIVHVGGPACNNIRPILEYADTANFGRCDCGKINRILDGEKMDSVWRRDSDPDFTGEYRVDSSNIDGLGADEKAFGCRQKCAFCFYSHWNGYVSRSAKAEYDSGVAGYEDFFQSIDWRKCIRGGVTALDGATEQTRLRVNKPITADTIKKTLLRSNELKTETLLRAKVYGIVGYPWESKNALENFDLPRLAAEVEPQLRNKILLRMHFSHFIPFQKTPLWDSRFNWNNYRQWCLNHPVLYHGPKVRILSGGTFMGAPAMAATSTVIQRATASDADLIRSLATPKFQSMPSSNQGALLKKFAGHLLAKQTAQTIGNIKTPNE